MLVTFRMTHQNYNESNIHIADSVNGKYRVFILTSHRVRQLDSCDSRSTVDGDERRTLCS